VSRVVSIERDGEAAARAALERCVGAGGVAVFPADGLYGLACDPLDSAAVARIQALKGRDERKASAVMYFSPLAMRELVTGLSELTRRVVAELLPGPVTLVIANPERRYPLASPDDPRRLGVRLIEGPLAGVRVPVLQTSANRSGEAASGSFDQLDPAIVGGAEVAIDGGALTGKPSTVIDLSELDSGGGWVVLREGALSGAELDRRLARLPDGH
jgi:L-threonylcarbamoyladenylate synthase